MTITPETIAKLRGLLEITSPLPWEWTEDLTALPFRAYYQLRVATSDAELIAAAVNALPALLDAAEQLTEVREQVTRGALCPMCSTGMSRRTVGMVCQICGTDYASPEYANLHRDSQETSETLIADALAVRAERDALAAAVARVREGHTPYPDYLPGPNGVPIRWERCQRCNGAYPCQPIRALDGSGS